MKNTALCRWLFAFFLLRCTQCFPTVHGNWSQFSDWSNCSRECGGGFEFRYRTCTNTFPRNGGKQCDGTGVQTRACHTHECPPKICSFDHLVKFVADLFPEKSFEVNNQFIGALHQVTRAKETAKGITSNVRLDKRHLIRRINTAVDQKELYYGRVMLGFLIQRKQNCYVNGQRIFKEVKESLGDERFKDLLSLHGNVSLIFTLDTTKSMKEEIPQIRALAKALNSYSRRAKVEYILSTYNDPDHGLVKRFANEDKRKFDNAIGRLSTFGGGDCKEPTFEGIINAIDLGTPFSSSPIYVFTDSPSKAKGYRTWDAVIGLARDQMMNINFFFSSYGCANPMLDRDYRNIIEDTGGVELFFSSPLSFFRAEDVIKSDLDGTAIISTGSYKGSEIRMASRRIEFPVDKTILRLIVSISAVSNRSAVSLFDSTGNKILRKLQMFEGVLWIVENPANGTWALVINPSVKTCFYMIKASNVLNINFDLIFVRTPQLSRQQVQISNPLQGEKARAKVIIPRLSRLNKSTLKLYLLDKYGTPISPLLLSNEGEVTFDLPATNSFRIRLTGNTSDGEPFMRTSTNIRPSKAILRTKILPDLLNIKRGRISYFRAIIDYASERPRLFRIVGYSFTRGIKLTMRRTVRVTKSRPGSIPVFIVTRFKVPAGTVARIHITAKSHDVRTHLLESVMVT